MKTSWGEECLAEMCQKNWAGGNGSRESALQALAAGDRDFLVEQETSPLQLLMVDVKGQSEEGADRGKGIAGN